MKYIIEIIIFNNISIFFTDVAWMCVLAQTSTQQKWNQSTNKVKKKKIILLFWDIYYYRHCLKLHTHLCRIWATESTHFLEFGGMTAWEFPDIMSTTQVLLDSKSETGREPSSKSRHTPPPQLTAWLKRFIWKDTQNISDYNNTTLTVIQLGLQGFSKLF